MTTLELDPILWGTWIVQVLLPLVTGLATNRLTSSLHKTLILTALNLGAGVGSEWLRTTVDGGTYDLNVALFTFVTGLIGAFLAYDKFYKKTNLPKTLQEVGMSKANIEKANELEEQKAA